MPFPEEANRSFQRQIAKVQDELLDAQRELLERKAMEGGKPERDLWADQWGRNLRAGRCN